MSQTKLSKSSKAPQKSCFSGSILLIIPLIILFFCAGVFIGSKLGGEGAGKSLRGSLGLPGTNNIFKKWTDSEGLVYNSLRGKTEKEQENKKIDRLVQIPPNEIPRLIPEIIKQSENIHDKPLASTVYFPNSLNANGFNHMEVPSSFDNSDLMIGAWIYLHESEFHDSDMRTIFSNKYSGCGTTSKQFGLAMFVNGWENPDHKVYVEYGGANSGCYKIDSQNIALNSNHWYHLLVHFSPDLITLFIDGEKVNSLKPTEPHLVQMENPLFVGQFNAAGDFSFYGNISNFAVAHLSSPLTELQQQEYAKYMMNLRENNLKLTEKGNDLVAFYTLCEATLQLSGSTAKDLIGNSNGKYVFPTKQASFSTEGVGINLIDGVGNRPVTPEMRAQSDTEARKRREKIKEGMKHAWTGYKEYAWGKDEVKPLSGKGTENWGGMGVTLVDSLDTLWLMGMKEEFEEAKKWVAKSLSFANAGSVSVFETTIRELGGLLAAFDWSGDQVFLTKAKKLADLLTPAFKTKSGIPTGMVNFRTHSASGGWAGGSAILSELGTLQVEFRYLADHVNEPRYEALAMRALQVMNSKRPRYGLFPIKVSTADGGFTDSQITFGALGDSFYEYLLKLWLQGGKKETWLREMYDRAIDGAIEKLLLASEPSGLAFLSDFNGRYNNRKMDHLVCFMPGLMALGAYTDPNGLSSPRATRDLAVAKALMYTCHEMYHRMKTGISPEYVEFPKGKDMVPGHSAAFYILRPETAESLYILNHLTGDPIYRDWAWDIWTAIDATCRTNIAYAAIRNVNQPGGGGQDDRMESFFLAETMKYLYLAQDPDSPIDLLNKHVFNTEAHPLRILDYKHKAVSPGS